MSVTAILGLLLACGDERWTIKTMRDAAAVDLAPIDATVEALVAIPAPPRLRGRVEAERHAYRLAAAVLGAKREADGDLHVVIAGESGATMIVEFPEARCLVGSRVATEANAARAAFLELLPSRPTPRYRLLARPLRVTVEGVLFLDKIHGQTGVAPNGVELHPVTRIEVAP